MNASVSITARLVRCANDRANRRGCLFHGRRGVSLAAFDISALGAILDRQWIVLAVWVMMGFLDLIGLLSLIDRLTLINRIDRSDFGDRRIFILGLVYVEVTTVWELRLMGVIF